MTAQIVHIEPEVEAAILEGRLNKIELTEARMTLSGGVLSLRAKDLLPSTILPGEEVKEAKSTRERQRVFVQRKKDAGFKKDWVHVSVQELAQDAGGQEKIAASVDRLRRRAELAEKRANEAEAEVRRLKARRWWWFYR